MDFFKSCPAHRHKLIVSNEKCRVALQSYETQKDSHGLTQDFKAVTRVSSGKVRRALFENSRGVVVVQLIRDYCEIWQVAIQQSLPFVSFFRKGANQV